MNPLILQVIEILAGGGTCASIAYYLLSIWSAFRFMRDVMSGCENSDANLPPVSILKPLKGTDPQMYESLRSHCLQEYPEYEIIFGVSDPSDPAISLVNRVRVEFPQRSIRLIVCEKILGTNTKVSNLAQMVAYASHEHLLVNDSDIRVPADYLRKVIAPLTDADTGMVTCLYHGMAAPTLGSRLESLGISTDFAPGVLTARSLEDGIHFGLGSTLAFRRADLNAIGGFEAVADYLADDYELGHRIAGLGRKIELSRAVVETFLPPYSFPGFLAHQLRWGRTIRESRPSGYVGLLFTFGLPWAVLAVITSRGTDWSWTLLGLTVLVRCAMASVVGSKVLRDPQVLRWLWLLPLRDFLALLIWAASFAGHTVTWRGESFLLREGKLVRIE